MKESIKEKARFRVVREHDVNGFFDGDEAVQMYFKSGKLNFAIGILPPGKKTPMDPGELGVYVAFVLEGQAIFQAGDESKESVWLYEGDAVMIREELPHIVYNPLDEMSRIIWVLTPGHED